MIRGKLHLAREKRNRPTRGRWPIASGRLIVGLRGVLRHVQHADGNTVYITVARVSVAHDSAVLPVPLWAVYFASQAISAHNLPVVVTTARAVRHWFVVAFHALFAHEYPTDTYHLSTQTSVRSILVYKGYISMSLAVPPE